MRPDERASAGISTAAGDGAKSDPRVREAPIRETIVRFPDRLATAASNAEVRSSDDPHRARFTPSNESSRAVLPVMPASTVGPRSVLEALPKIEEIVPPHYLQRRAQPSEISVVPCALRADSDPQREFGRGFHIAAPAGSPLQVFRVDSPSGERVRLCEVRSGDPFLRIGGMFVVGPVSSSAGADGQALFRLASLRSLPRPTQLIVSSGSSEATFVVMPGSSE